MDLGWDLGDFNDLGCDFGDFFDLEVALFGNEFGFILQRMWAFRGFRIAGINRAMCEGWFNTWVNLGWNFNIKDYQDWDIYNTGFIFPVDFAFDDFIVAVPAFNWSI